MNEQISENYERFKDEPFFGTYMFGKPVLNINDIELLRHILVKDFNHFSDRADSNLVNLTKGGEMDKLWANQLTNLCGNRWKDVRSTFSPIFTSGKMKGMLKFIVEVGNRLNKEMGTLASKGEDFELKGVYGKFSMDSISSCAFGVDPNSFENADDHFIRCAARIFINTMSDNLKIFTRFLPGGSYLHQKLGLDIFKPKETRFFMNIIKSTIRHRRETGDRRGDLIDLMIDCMKEEGVDTSDNIHKDQYEKDMDLNHDRSNKQQGMDEDLVVATALIMLVAGYDTTALTLGWLSYYLSINPDIQTKLQEEVDEAFETNGGALPDYNTIQSLPYLDMCIHETLRISSAVGSMLRACSKDYTLPNSNIHLKENDLIIVPAAVVHHNVEFYPNPKEFDPENFSKEARQGRSPYTFLAFGQGPRACIGMRFAMLEMKVAVLEILKCFTFLPSNKNLLPFKMDPTNQLNYPKGGLWAKVQARN